MKISEHTASSEKQVGIRGEDIHEWIDGFFDYDGLRQFLKKEQQPGYDPYGHRHYRHCYEALEDAYIEFENKYSREDIKAVFECHIKDDYNGYLPTREDFINGTFKDKYHEEEDIGMRDSVLSRKELKQYFRGKRYSQFKAPERKLNSLFRLKIIMPTVIAVILFISSVFAIIIPTFRSNIIDRKKEMIKELTAAASSLIEEKIRMNESGQLSLEEAQELALSEIQDMRYGPENKDYFWITDMKPLMLMHPYRTELTGSDLTGYKDTENKSGKNLFVEFVKMVESDGEGYLQYLWQWKDDSTRVVPKLSYVRGIPEWGWIIGTGIYINDVTDEIISMSDKLIIIFLIISAFLIVLMTYVIMQSLKIDTELIKAESGLREANSRYRALVEVSNEGHVMLMDGVNIFSNHTLKKMLGLTEKEIMGTDLNELLPADLPMNKSAIEKLKELVRGNIQTTEFEGQIRTGDKIVDVIISTAKIFFAGNNGCIVSFRPNVRRSENFMLDSFGGTRFHPGVLFMAKKASELCTNNISDAKALPDDTPRIKHDTSIFEVLTVLKQFEKDRIIVNDKDKQICGTLGFQEIAMMYSGLPTGILYEIRTGDTIGNIVKSLDQVPEMVANMTRQGVKPNVLRETLGKIYESTVKKIISLTLEELDLPDVKFAFLSLGSTARHEMTLFSDQDNALIFEDLPEEDVQKVRLQLLRFTDMVCAKLNDGGYPYCPGGIMASNPKWCLTLTEWKKRFSVWISKASPQSILDIHVFFDIEISYGDKSLVNDLKEFINLMIKNNPGFLVHFAKNLLGYKDQISLLGNIRSETKDGVKTINIKESLMPIVNFARIYSLRYNVSEAGSKPRLSILRDSGVLSEGTYNELMYIFNHLWHLRFYNQVFAHQGLRKVNDEFDIDCLTEIERQNLRNVLAGISKFQAKINFDFLGGVSNM